MPVHGIRGTTDPDRDSPVPSSYPRGLEPELELVNGIRAMYRARLIATVNDR